MHTGLLPWQQSSKNMKMNTHLHLTKVMLKCTTVSFYSPNAFMTQCWIKPRDTFTILCHLHIYGMYQLSHVSVYFPTSYLLNNLHLCMSFSSDDSWVLLWLRTLLCGGGACFSVCDALLVSAEPTTCQPYTADVYEWFHQLQRIHTVLTWSK
jgi:hypothetical protein